MSSQAEPNAPSIGVKGSTQHLWNLLRGKILVASEDVVQEELQDCVERIELGLTYYVPYEEKEGEKQIVFSTLPSFIRVAMDNGDDKRGGGSEEGSKPEDLAKPGSASRHSSKTESERNSSFDPLRKAIAQKLKLEISVATDLLVSYMMFEYKGSNTSYDEITDTQRSFSIFMKDLTEYYMRERACLLLCTQTILANLGDENHRFYNMFEYFRSLISYKKWCWGLLNSIEFVKNEIEVVEILHSLLLLMYKLPAESIPEFFAYINKAGFSDIRKSERMRMAEGAVMQSAILVSGLTDCCTSTFPSEFSELIREFMTKNFEALLFNEYNIAAVFAAYDVFCKDDPALTQKMRRLPCNPSLTFASVLKLAENYGKNSLYDRHSLSLIVSSGIFEAFEILLANYDASHFGTNQQGFLILSKILQHNLLAENFLCGTPLALTALYTDATITFPIDVASPLHIWKSLCMSVKSAENCKTLIQGVAKLNCIAEYVDEMGMAVKRIGEFGVTNLKRRKVYGITLEAGATGMMNTHDEAACISWDIPASKHVSAFKVIRYIIEPMANELHDMDAVIQVSDDAFENYDYCPIMLHAVCEFIIQFMHTTDVQILELTQLIHPACIIMERLLKHIRNTEEKVRLIQYQMGIVAAVNEFAIEKIALFMYIYDIVPGSDTVGLVESMILGRESVSSTKCEVTIAFLKMILSFAENQKCWHQGHSSDFESRFLRSIGFIAENIVSSCVSWRVENEGIRLEVYLRCLQIFRRIYSLKNSVWNELKEDCLKFIISPSSCLTVIIQTDESELLNSIIRPIEDNRELVPAMCTALELLLQITEFDMSALMCMDSILEGTLVRIMGRLVRLRLNPEIPTLAMNILKQIAEHTSLSLLACFGNDEAAFRDVILQRLEFSAEDINLKVAVLEFMTVISQTQVGIIQCFYANGVLESSILDLILENEDLSVACLKFFRSLFRQHLPLPRSLNDFWGTLLLPLMKVKRGSRLGIVTATLHILTFELFTNGISDSNLTPELEKLLRKDQFKAIVQTVVADIDVSAGKCLLAIKHFLTLVLGRPELVRLLPKETLISVQGIMLMSFWSQVPENRQICTILIELVTILTIPGSATPDFLSEFVLKIMETFPYHGLAVQLSILGLINKCYTHCSESLRNGVIENTIRILKKVLDASMKMIEELDAEHASPLLIVISCLITTIIEKQPVDVWGPAFQRDMIPLLLLSISSAGIVRQKAPDVVSNCLSALITLAEHPQGSNLFQSSGISKTLWIHLYKFTEEECEEAWTNVFLLCLNLNSKLLTSQKHQYLEEALAFWGLHSSFLNHKLFLMTNLSEICVIIEDTDKGYNDMKAVLTCNMFVLHDILTLMPYLEEWQKSQPSEVFKAIRGVFYVLQEATSLLRQPFLLQSSMSFKNKSTEIKLSPRLLEVQTKLWEICDISMQILVALKTKADEFIEKNDLIPTTFQVGQLCIKALTKGERKHHAGINVTSRVYSTLEKAMLIVYNYTMPLLDDATIDSKQQNAFRRELGTEVISLCDGIRRLAAAKTDFLITLCSKMETKFK